MNLQLPNNVYTNQDIEDLIFNIQVFAKWYGQDKVKKRLSVSGRSSQPDISSEASELLHDWSIQTPLSVASIDELIEGLENFKETAEQITITLATVPSGSLKMSLVNWFRQNVKLNILVNFQVNKEILGGIVVRSGSRIFDLSFRRQLIAAKDKFPGILHNV